MLPYFKTSRIKTKSFVSLVDALFLKKATGWLSMVKPNMEKEADLYNKSIAVCPVAAWLTASVSYHLAPTSMVIVLKPACVNMGYTFYHYHFNCCNLVVCENCEFGIS